MSDNLSQSLENLNICFQLCEQMLSSYFGYYYNLPLQSIMVENNNPNMSNSSNMTEKSEQNSKKRIPIFGVVNMKLFKKEDVNPITYTRKNGHQRLNFRSDCIRKRFKTFANNYALRKMSKLLASQDADSYLFKLPKTIVTDMKIESNRKLLSMTIKEAYSLFVPDEEEKVRIFHNKKIMELIDNGQNQELKNIINTKYRTIIQEYLESNEFEKDCATLEIRDGSVYLKKYRELAESFLSYYSD